MPGCLQTSPRELEGSVDRPGFIDVHLLADGCPPSIRQAIAAIGEAPAPTKQKTQLVGTHVRVTLTPSLGFTGEVKSLGSETRRLQREMRSQWSWELLPKTAGEYTFTLVVSVLDADGKEVDFDNPRETFLLTVPQPKYHWLKRTWSWTEGAASALVALGTSLAAIVTWIFILIRWWRRPRKMDLPPAPAAIDVAEFQTNLRRTLDRFEMGARGPITVGREGRAEAVVISAAYYDAMRGTKEAESTPPPSTS